VLCCRDVGAGGCRETEDVDLSVEADATVNLDNPTTSSGREDGLAVTTVSGFLGAEALVRFRDAALTDAALVDGVLTLRPHPVFPVGDDSPAVQLSTLTSEWTEFRAGCEGVSTSPLCDGDADGVCAAGPDPSINNQVRPWPNASATGLPGFTNIITTTTLERAVSEIPLSIGPTPLRAELDENTAAVPALTFRLSSRASSVILSSKETPGPRGASLLLRRCLSR
jgi:hypothetical protein